MISPTRTKGRSGQPVRHLTRRRAGSGPWPHALRAGLLGIVLTISGCWATSTQPSAFRVTGQDIAGSWCGAEGERFTFRPDAGFAVAGIGPAYRDDLLGDSRYADGYRVRTEFGGVPPTSGAGTWELADGGNRLYLTYDNLDRNPFTEGSTLDPEQHDGQLRLVLYLGDRDSGDTYPFERCVSA